MEIDPVDLPMYASLAAYFGGALAMLNLVYDASKEIVDEMFHLPQGKAYCEGRYDVWDEKITTLPGLYIAAKMMNIFVDCQTYYLRFFNLLASTVNMLMFQVLLSIIYGLSCSKFNVILQSLNLALLPPLFFFSLVFYTDTLSLTFLLLFTYSVIKKHNFSIIFYGIWCVLTRQINIVWIAMITGQKFVELFIKSSRVYRNKFLPSYRKRGSGISLELDPKALKRHYDFKDFLISVYYHVTDQFYYLFLTKRLVTDWQAMFYSLVPSVVFIFFVLFNGSIVVGDKQAHTVSINGPQIFYFLLFYGFFGLPIILSRLKSVLKFMWSRKFLVVSMLLVFALIVHFNTTVHPYILADNRHYTFYIWNRWFGKYPEAIYLTVPVYVFLGCSLIDNLIHQNCFSFNLVYFLALIPGLCFQRLLEIRYFIIPYIIARMRFPKCPTWVAICEFIWYFAINVAFFRVFFSKEIMWDDFKEPQRIIW